MSKIGCFRNFENPISWSQQILNGLRVHKHKLSHDPSCFSCVFCAFKLTAKSGHFGSFYPTIALIGRFCNFLKNAKTTERINDFIPTLLTHTHTKHHEKEYMDIESAKADLLPFCTLFIVLLTQNFKIKSHQYKATEHSISIFFQSSLGWLLECKRVSPWAYAHSRVTLFWSKRGGNDSCSEPKILTFSGKYSFIFAYFS